MALEGNKKARFFLQRLSKPKK